MEYGYLFWMQNMSCKIYTLETIVWDRIINMDSTNIEIDKSQDEKLRAVIFCIKDTIMSLQCTKFPCHYLTFYNLI